MQRNFKQLIYFPLIAVIMTALGSCGKNEFKISGSLKNAGTRNLTMVYTALSNKTDELVKSSVACNNDVFAFTGVTRYPTLVWIYAADGTFLHLVYAEKGDDIKISGLYNSPAEWKITGNKATERFCQWMAANVALISADNPVQLNAAIAKFVKENPKETASALVMLAFYHRNTDEAGFIRLWDELKLSDSDKERLLHLAMTQMDEARTKAAAVTVTPLTLRNRADTTATLSPAQADATIMYFWRKVDESHKGALRVLSSQPDNVQIADIYLDPDTVQWRYNMQNDTVKRRNALWTFGGEMNLGLKRLAIPETPYFIVADKKGRQLYRGASAAEAASSAAKAVTVAPK